MVFLPDFAIENLNRDGAYWIEARPSMGGVPYDELPVAQGFPRWVGSGETYKFSVDEAAEVLYRRSFEAEEETSSAGELGDVLYRIVHRENLPVSMGRIYPMLRIGYTQVTEVKRPSVGPGVKAATQPEIFLTDARKSYKKFEIIPFYKKAGFAATSGQLYITVENKVTGLSDTKLIAENQLGFVLESCGKIALKKDVLVIKYKTGRWSSPQFYRDMGYSVPLQIPLSIFAIY